MFCWDCVECFLPPSTSQPHLNIDYSVECCGGRDRPARPLLPHCRRGTRRRRGGRHQSWSTVWNGGTLYKAVVLQSLMSVEGDVTRLWVELFSKSKYSYPWISTPYHKSPWDFLLLLLLYCGLFYTGETNCQLYNYTVASFQPGLEGHPTLTDISAPGRKTTHLSNDE